MKIPKLLMVILLLGFLVLSVSADELNPLVYQYYNPEVTIEFLEPLQVSSERQQNIANQIAGVTPISINDPNVEDPENLICTLFGHNLEGPVTVTATHHKVRQYAPRCLKEVYHVSYCTRCDYTESELHNDFYIFCCPED